MIRNFLETFAKRYKNCNNVIPAKPFDFTQGREPVERAGIQ